MERKIYKPGHSSKRRQEWVDLESGSLVVREMTVATSAQVAEQSTRFAGTAHASQDPGAALAAQILFSCYDGEEDNAERIFTSFDAIWEIPFGEMRVIQEAIQRVNGLNATEDELVRDFTRATQDRLPSASAASASRNSTDSPKKLTPR